MKHKRVGLLLGIGAVLIALGFVHVSKGVATVVAPQPKAPAAQPHPLKGVSAIVEFDIVSAAYTYDDVMGPRTQFNLANVVVHSGTVTGLKSLSQFGGPLPDGSMVFASGLPVLTPGAHYILFLGADSWFYTPVWTYLAFRTEQIGSRSIVVGPNGAAVTSISAAGVTFGKAQIVDLSGPNDPLTPRPRSTTLSDTAQEIVEAIDPASFITAATKAANDVGAQFGATTPTVPSLLGGVSKWNAVNGTPAPTL